MKKITILSLLSLLLWLVPSCSLFKIQLASDSVPLPKSDLNIRVATQQFVSSAFADISQTVDSVRSLTKEGKVVANTLLWAINAETGLQGTVFQQSPRYALMDTWLFTRQLNGFLTPTRAKELFSGQAPIVVGGSQSLETRIAEIARRNLPTKEFAKMEEFVGLKAKENPLVDLGFARQSVYNDWLEFNQIPDTAMITTVGTLPEVVSDFANRMTVMKSGLESTTQWRLDYFSQSTGLTPEAMKASSDSIAAMSERLVRFAEQSPELVEQAILLLNQKLSPLMNQLERRIGMTMFQISQERDSISLLVTQERQAIMTSLDSISVNVTREAMEHVKGVIATAIGWITLLLAVIIILPFVVGFFSARLIYRKKGKPDKPSQEEDAEQEKA